MNLGYLYTFVALASFGILGSADTRLAVYLGGAGSFYTQREGLTWRWPLQKFIRAAVKR